MSDFIIENGILKKYTGNGGDVVIPDGVTTIGDSVFCGCTSLTSVKIPDSVTKIGDSAFKCCTSLTSVQIPDSVTKIGDDAFDGCTSLTSVQIPDSVTKIGDDAFYGTPWLEEQRKKNVFVIINHILIDGYACQGDVQIPDSVTTIGDSAFFKCEALTSVKIPDGVTTIGHSAFSRCISLTSVQIPDSVTKIGRCAFFGCTRLKEVSLPENITLEEHAFPPETNIIYRKKEETAPPQPEPEPLPDTSPDTGFWSVKSEHYWQNSKDFLVEDDILQLYTGNAEKPEIPYNVEIIGTSAFARCSEMTCIDIPDSVTEIRNCAFAFCRNLTEITLPQNIRFGKYVFLECPSLRIVKIRFPNGAVGTFDNTALETMFQNS